MKPEQLLENYISKHPDYWDFENELKEVARLKKICEVGVLLETASV